MSYSRLDTPPLDHNRTRYPPIPQLQQQPGHLNNMQSKLPAFLRPMYPSKDSKMTPTRRKKLLLSYAPDWIITIVLAAIFFSLDKVQGYRRVFSLEDTSLRHPYAVQERVPDAMLYIICAVVPIVLQPIINFFTVRSWWDFHNSLLGLILGLALTGSATQFIKITVGRPRPDIIDRCQPPEGLVDPVFKLTDWTICTQVDDKILNDGFRSFPSGHSSMSFAGLGFLSFYLAGKLHLFDKRGHAGKSWLAVTPFFGAALVAISRTMDYRHHWHDVLVGSALGTAFAYFAYRQYYPSLASEVSHRPYSPRIKPEGGDSLLPHHVDPETGMAITSSYNPTGLGGGTVPSNRYNSNSPSPPPAAFTGNSKTHEYESVGYELHGTVPRPGQEPLHEVWKEGADIGLDGTVPRSRDQGGEGDVGGEQEDRFTIPLRTAPQQQQQPHAQKYEQTAYSG